MLVILGVHVVVEAIIRAGAEDGGTVLRMLWQSAVLQRHQHLAPGGQVGSCLLNLGHADLVLVLRRRKCKGNVM